MLGENLKKLRQQKGFTQESLAIQLHVVRQTVSKWEKNLSVPDAEMLQRIAEVLEAPVGALLGADLPPDPERNEIAEQLTALNEQLAIRNRRTKRIWSAIGIVLATLVVLRIGLTLLGVMSYSELTAGESIEQTETISELAEEE
ncbi:MAG: helix-turn-helix transcriptional regulator [Clostridia bacterium]|nr:helix-turn-helix transcriptional regulator [Clostridia bacterium]